MGTLTSWKPLGHSRPVTGLLYLHPKKTFQCEGICILVTFLGYNNFIYWDLLKLTNTHFYNNNINCFYNKIVVLVSVLYWIFLFCSKSSRGSSYVTKYNNPWTLSTVQNCFAELATVKRQHIASNDVATTCVHRIPFSFGLFKISYPSTYTASNSGCLGI